MHLSEELQTVDIRHPDVGKEHVIAREIPFKGLPRGGEGIDLIAGAQKRLLEKFAGHGVVIDDQDPDFLHALSLPKSLLPHVMGQIRHPAGISPFIVIPGHHLRHVVPKHLGELHIHDGGVGIPLEVHRHQGDFLAGHDPLELLPGGLRRGPS